MKFIPASVSDKRIFGSFVEVAQEVYPSSSLSVPDIEFGHTDPTSLTKIREKERAEWHIKASQIPPSYSYRLHDAVVHGPFGIVTVGEFVLKECLDHIPFHWPGYGRTEEAITIPDSLSLGSLENGLAAIGGNFNNFFHWTLDILPKLQIAPFSEQAFQGTVILPLLRTAAHLYTMRRLSEAEISVSTLASGRHLKATSLLFTPNLVGWGYAPNPGLSAFFNRIKEGVKTTKRPGRKIYISRRDSSNRVLINEAEIENIVAKSGFEVLSLSELSIEDQIAAFSDASHIIAPHGAGLTNLVYAGDGCSLCELQMDQYINWCFRRIAGMKKIRYGCVVGSEQPYDSCGGSPRVDRPWSVDTDTLRVLLDSSEFLNTVA